MADGATWQGRPISLQEFMAEGGILAAQCGSPSCGTVTALTNRAFQSAAGTATISRLEEGVRCTCGWRGGSLAMLAQSPEVLTKDRCYLFHG
jgi:hypothetical protein